MALTCRAPRDFGLAPRAVARKGEGPESTRVCEDSGPSKKIRQRPTLPRGFPRSTIGSGGLNFRVRDGNGCDPSDIATGKVATVHTKGKLQVSASSKSRCALKCFPGGCVGRIQASALAPSPLLPGKRGVQEMGESKPLDQLVPVSSTRYRAYTPGLSTSSSSTGLQGLAPGIPVLEVGFPLRCFQRLSNRHMATQRCLWRDNWYTSGASNPVLSY